MNAILGTTGDLILVGLGILLGFGLCCFWVIKLKARITEINRNWQVSYTSVVKDANQQYWRAVEAENKLSKRGEKGRFVKKNSNLPRTASGCLAE